MNVHRALNHGVRCLRVHHIEDGVDHFIATYAQDGRPEYLTRLRVDDDLHEALRLTLLDRACNSGHGALADECAAPARAHFRLVPADAAKRRIRVEGVGGNAVTHAPRIPIEKICRYDFAIDSSTLAAIRTSAPHLTRLSRERVQQELVKTMEQVRRPSGALRTWRDVGALSVLIPALSALDDVALATLDELPRAREGQGARARPQRTTNRVAALFLDVPPAEVRRSMTELRFSKHEINWAVSLVERWAAVAPEIAEELVSGVAPDLRVRRWLARIGRLHEGAFLRVAMARWVASARHGSRTPDEFAVRTLHRRMRASLFRGDPIELGDLAISGDDLRGAGIPAGPIYAKILHALLEWVLEDPSRNTPDALLTEMRQVVASLEGSGGRGVQPESEP
jgi:tRNA nucleotidyltransferase (CCA-adding enzyme)